MHRRVHFGFRFNRHFLLRAVPVFVLAVSSVLAGPALAAQSKGKAQPSSKGGASPTATAQRYVEALASGDRVTVGRLDFACQYRFVSGKGSKAAAVPPEDHPLYTDCWNRMEQAHAAVVEQNDRGMDLVWPGKGMLVFFTEDLSHYAPSFFAMSLLGTSPPGSGLRVETLSSAKIPAASFRLRGDGPVLSAPATRVRLRLTYKDPLTSPIAYAPGTYQWTNPVKRPRQALKAVTVDWIALSGLKRLGFPTDVAVVNLPVASADQPGGPIPFLTERGGYVDRSAAWWEPGDAPGLLIASVGRAAHFPELRDRVAMLNRLLLIDPLQPDALTLLTRDLYEALLHAGAQLHRVPVGDPQLADRFSQLYWDTYSQTTRVEISLGMEIGGFANPTPADYLYRLIPAMEKLAKIRPEDLENRLRLGIAYRWNNDQLVAIQTHEQLVREIPPGKTDFKARALIELAWSRIAKVSWNRTFDDPGIVTAYKEAEEAFNLTDRPVDKFAAAYTMAYSLMFTPNRDNKAVLEKLTAARDWYKQLPGSSIASWRYLLDNDTMKGVVETDPAFQPLLSAFDVRSDGRVASAGR